MEWTGTNWVGSWPLANISISPPGNVVGSRAIFVGNGTTWTTGGEGFCLLLNSPLATGQTYSFDFTYVSHGLGSDGNFSPFFYTNNTPTIVGAYNVESLSPAGYTWISNTLTFTATASQSGHTWVAIHTGATGSSGVIYPSCISQNVACSINIGNDTTLCQDETLTLDATTPNATYLWQDNSTNPTFIATQQGSYWVEVTVNNCSAIDSILISEEDCAIILEMPNVFSPNNDGINDLFVPIISKGIVSMETIVYNRWGNKIFKTDNLLIEWKGQDVSDGTYFWFVYYIDKNGIGNSLKGYVTILK